MKSGELESIVVTSVDRNTCKIHAIEIVHVALNDFFLFEVAIAPHVMFIEKPFEVLLRFFGNLNAIFLKALQDLLKGDSSASSICVLIYGILPVPLGPFLSKPHVVV